MFELRAPQNVDMILQFSPLVRAAERTLRYMQEQGSIGLTKSKAFHRKFLNWAATAYEFPGQEVDELFCVTKVLNEIDFPAAMMVHFLLKEKKYGRHYKEQFRLTKSGGQIMDDPVALFDAIIPMFLFEVRFDWGRTMDAPIGNWDMYLNVMNVELQTAKSGSELSEVFFGPRPEGFQRDDPYYGFYSHILRPLTWAGLLQKTSSGRISFSEHEYFTKSPLWNAALQLETDDMLKPAIVN